jgi:hypothetical protein
MSVKDYEVIDCLHHAISNISRNEDIDRAKALKALQGRLTYQQRRIEVLLGIGWINGFEPVKSAEH